MLDSLLRAARRRRALAPLPRDEVRRRACASASGAWSRRSTRTIAFDFAAYTATNRAAFEAAYADFRQG